MTKFEEVHIYSVGSGKRVQFAKGSDGFWYSRHNRRHYLNQVRWSAWAPIGTKTRPDNVWYNPKAGKAHLQLN